MDKIIVYPGVGDTVELVNECKVLFDYEAKYDDGTPKAGIVVDDTRRKYPHGYGKQLELVIGKKFRVPVFEECLKSMKMNEVASFRLNVCDLTDFAFVARDLRNIASGSKSSQSHKCASSLISSCAQNSSDVGCLGYSDLDDFLKDPHPLRITFDLHKVLYPSEYERDSWQLKSDEKLESLSELRTRGNAAYRSGELENAEEQYKLALSRIDSLLLYEKPQEPEFVTLEKEKIPFLLNLAQIELARTNYYEVVRLCDEVLKHEDNSTKALFRRGKANVKIGNYADARRDFDLVVQFDSSLEKVVCVELNKLEKMELDDKHVLKDRCQKMFST